MPSQRPGKPQGAGSFPGNLKRILVVVGVVLLLIAGYEYDGIRRFLGGALVADGTVITASHRGAGGDVSHTVVVRFTTRTGERIDFRPPLLTNPDSYKKGDRVKVYYLPSNPRSARTDIWGNVVFEGGGGILLLVAAGGMTLFSRRKRRHAEDLRSRGRQLVTNVQKVEVNKKLSVGGANPYVIRSEWEDPSTGKTHLFTSDNLWFDPTEFVTNKTIQVFVAADDPADYWMDLSFLPEDRPYTAPKEENQRIPVLVPRRERKLGTGGKIAIILLAALVLKAAYSMWQSNPKAAVAGFFMLVFAAFFVIGLILTVIRLSRIVGFRCPQCRTRIWKPVDNDGKEGVPICFYCDKCDILWDSGVRTSSGS